MIYLIGVNHTVQYVADLHEKPEYKEIKIKIQEFKNHILTEAKRLNISLIAEEMSLAALRAYGARDSVARSVATKLKIEHRFCDPDREQRKSLGLTIDMYDRDIIASRLGIRRDVAEWTPEDVARVGEEKKKSFHIREKFWLERIIEKIDQSIIFICGEEHTSSFTTILGGNNISSSIISTGWGKEEVGKLEKEGWI